MESNSADQHLRTIRTLMERSAVYRRALAPVMIYAGTVGMASAVAGLLLQSDSVKGFCLQWLATAMLVIAGSFLIARRQAFKDKESFWSPPTRRVGQALAPPLFVGFFVTCVMLHKGVNLSLFFVLIWTLLYGCALHSAGFFMPRGMKLFGWFYIGMSCVLTLFLLFGEPYLVTPRHWHLLEQLNPHWFMGFFFGALHLAYGLYLYLTEHGKNVA